MTPFAFAVKAAPSPSRVQGTSIKMNATALTGRRANCSHITSAEQGSVSEAFANKKTHTGLSILDGDV